jgi:hypothetical protein
MNLATTLEVCNTSANPLTANLAKSIAQLCPEPSQMALRNSEVPHSVPAPLRFMNHIEVVWLTFSYLCNVW